MIHYFIDLENVNKMGFIGLETIYEPTIIHVIASNKTPSINEQILYSTNKFDLYWKFEYAENGASDSLDIELAGYLGFEVAKNPNDTFYIVSKDKGYDSLLNSFRNKGINAYRVINLYGDTDSDNKKIGAKGYQRQIILEGLSLDIRQLVPEELCNDEDIVELANSLEASSSPQEVYDCFSQILGDRDGSIAYSLLEGFIHDYMENKQYSEISTYRYASDLNNLLPDCSDNDIERICEIIDRNTYLEDINREIKEEVIQGDKSKKNYFRVIRKYLLSLGKKKK